MAALKIKGRVILIGYDSGEKCVYSENIDLSHYYDGEHVWDRADEVKKLRLKKVKGYLFDGKGILDQEFETVFDLKTGRFKTGTIRYADGTIRRRR